MTLRKELKLKWFEFKQASRKGLNAVVGATVLTVTALLYKIGKHQPQETQPENYQSADEKAREAKTLAMISFLVFIVGALCLIMGNTWATFCFGLVGFWVEYLAYDKLIEVRVTQVMTQPRSLGAAAAGFDEVPMSWWDKTKAHASRIQHSSKYTLIDLQNHYRQHKAWYHLIVMVLSIALAVGVIEYQAYQLTRAIVVGLTGFLSLYSGSQVYKHWSEVKSFGKDIAGKGAVWARRVGNKVVWQQQEPNSEPSI